MHSNLSDVMRADMLQWSTAPDSYIMSRWRSRLVEEKASFRSQEALKSTAIKGITQEEGEVLNTERSQTI